MFSFSSPLLIQAWQLPGELCREDISIFFFFTFFHSLCCTRLSRLVTSHRLLIPSSPENHHQHGVAPTPHQEGELKVPFKNKEVFIQSSLFHMNVVGYDSPENGRGKTKSKDLKPKSNRACEQSYVERTLLNVLCSNFC